MLRLALGSMLLFSLVHSGFAQPAAGTASSICTFEDGNQISIRYSNEPQKGKNKLSEGKVWSPGGEPMLLFSQSAVSIANTVIPAGAYRVYIIPKKNSWILVVNKNVGTGEYDPQQDLVRAPMESGQVDKPEPFSIQFGHVGAKQCSMRVYYEKTGSWADFFEK